MDLDQFEGHTPGPWSVDSGSLGPNICADGFVGRIAFMQADLGKPYISESAQSELKANSLLAAAAPDLLAEVRRLADRVADLERENARAIAENQCLAGQLRKLRPLVSYGGTY